MGSGARLDPPRGESAGFHLITSHRSIRWRNIRGMVYISIYHVSAPVARSEFNFSKMLACVFSSEIESLD